MKNPFNGRLAAFALGAFLVSGNALAQGKGETVRVVDAPGIGNMPLRVAIRKGYCEKYGIKRLALFGSVIRDDFRPDFADKPEHRLVRVGRQAGLIRLP